VWIPLIEIFYLKNSSGKSGNSDRKMNYKYFQSRRGKKLE
jgi:hypothetical protein